MIITTGSLARVSSDSTGKTLFPELTKQIGLKIPKPKVNEYEIRVWGRLGLRYGEAQMAYVLRRTAKKFTIVKYIISSDQHGFQSSMRLKPTVPITPLFWERLLKRNILTLPDMSVVLKRLYREPETPPTDTVHAGMQADGSFTVKGHKTRRRTLISDGDAYLFEVISSEGYRVYSYGNPRSYFKEEPQNKELQNVVGILDDLSLVFWSNELGRKQAKAITKNQD